VKDRVIDQFFIEVRNHEAPPSIVVQLSHSAYQTSSVQRVLFLTTGQVECMSHNEPHEPRSLGKYTPHHRLISAQELNAVNYVTNIA
jgi:hypothetical protein